FDSDWASTIPPGGTIRGVISFDGPLEKAVTAVDLSFSTVYGIGAPGSITVADIMLIPGL
ncbi:MAG TPA: hypothetical protein VFQ48_04470, partial [Pseudonocardiaceae bacterium]|nr:hypothetical protein [Pseudonocardiaceae bacterium]